MKILKSVGLAALFCALSVSSASASCVRSKVSGADRAIPSSGKISQGLLDKAVLIEVNYTRCKAGLAPLKRETRITRSASSHSKWMARNSRLTHNSNIHGQRSLQERMKKTGLKYKTGSENISRMYRYQLAGRKFFVEDASACKFADTKGRAIPPHSYATLARSAVRMWAESPSHRKNMMDGQMRLTGTAAALNSSGRYCGSIYITQDFLG